MKRKSTIGLNIFVIAVAVLYVIISAWLNVGRVSVAVAVEDGSYASSYAEKSKLTVVTLSDSEKVYYDQRYEQFDYNVNDGRITLESYSGSSTDLVVPSTIEGKKVVALGDTFMKNLNSVKNIYIPSSVAAIGGDVVSTVTICCSDDNRFYLANKDAGWTFRTVYDSDFINFNLGDIPYEYNVKPGSVEITRYTGNDRLIVIPSYINGLPVTEVSMNLLGTSEIVVIPKTVQSITGIAGKAVYSSVFAVEMVFTVMSVLLALLVVNILLPRYRKQDGEEYMLTGSQMVEVVIFVILQVAFGIYSTYFGNVSVYIAVIVSLAILVLFVAIVIMTGGGRQHAKSVEKRNEEKTARMKSIKLSAKGLAENISDAETRKLVQRVEDEIKFSDPVTSADLDDLESEIEMGIDELKLTIRTGDNAKIQAAATELMNLVRERNKICKAGK